MFSSYLGFMNVNPQVGSKMKWIRKWLFSHLDIFTYVHSDCYVLQSAQTTQFAKSTRRSSCDSLGQAQLHLWQHT